MCIRDRTTNQGEAKGGDGFWEKAEALLYQALIAYIYYEAPAEERNMNTPVSYTHLIQTGFRLVQNDELRLVDEGTGNEHHL